MLLKLDINKFLQSYSAPEIVKPVLSSLKVKVFNFIRA